VEQATGPAIVIFGAAVRRDGSPSNALRRRVEAAAELGRTLADPLFVPTGGAGRHGPAEAVVMAGLLHAMGVRAGAILQETTGTDTLSSVRAVARLLRGRRGLVFAATDAYHLPRCLVLLRLAGLRAQACPPPAGPAARALCRRWYWRLREVPAPPYDAALLLAGRLLRPL
jgi:vancomycin permeability regulator SanA